MLTAICINFFWKIEKIALQVLCYETTFMTKYVPYFLPRLLSLFSFTFSSSIKNVACIWFSCVLLLTCNNFV